jgi:hypothetical protein
MAGSQNREKEWAKSLLGLRQLIVWENWSPAEDEKKVLPHFDKKMHSTPSKTQMKFHSKGQQLIPVAFTGSKFASRK